MAPPPRYQPLPTSEPEETLASLTKPDRRTFIKPALLSLALVLFVLIGLKVGRYYTPEDQELQTPVQVPTKIDNQVGMTGHSKYSVG